MAEKIINKVDITSIIPAASPRWGTLDEHRWQLRRGLLRLAELEDHFRGYAPEVFRQLREGSITPGQARKLLDTHCYKVFRNKPEQI